MAKSTSSFLERIKCAISLSKPRNRILLLFFCLFLFIIMISCTLLQTFCHSQKEEAVFLGNKMFIHSRNQYDSSRTECTQPISWEATETLFQRITVKLDIFDQINILYGKDKPIVLYSVEDKRHIISCSTQSEGTLSQSARFVLNMIKYSIPKEIHAMSGGLHGYVTGGLYNADMVMEALQYSGVALYQGMRVLDFGGSSGRTIAMLKAAFPHIEAYLSDPIRESISWAKENLETCGITCLNQGTEPPLTVESNFFDIIIAISIWSHYNPMTLGLSWFEEVHRLLRPGGVLVLTTHGWPAIFTKATDNITAWKIYHDMITTHSSYIAAFPGNVDWDNDTRNPDWGMAWLDVVWIRERVPHLSVKTFLPARNDCFQDVIVLTKEK